MHDVEHASQGIERGFEGRLVIDVVSQDAKCRADQEIGLPQRPRDLVEAGCQNNALGASHQQAEGNGLRIAIGERLVRSVGEQGAPPIGGKAGQRGAPSSICSMTSSRNRRHRRALISASCGADRGGMGSQLRNFSKSLRRPGGARSSAPRCPPGPPAERSRRRVCRPAEG